VPPHGSVVQGAKMAVIGTMIRVLHALKNKITKNMTFSKVSGLVHVMKGTIESTFQNFP